MANDTYSTQRLRVYEKTKPNRRRGDPCGLPKTNSTRVILRYHGCDAEGSRMANDMHQLHVSSPSHVRTQLSNHCVSLRFFAKKTEPKSLQGFKRQPRSLPGLRCPTICAAVCDTLPLRLFHEMRIDERDTRLSPVIMRSDIGHRPTFCSIAIMLATTPTL